MYRDDDEDEGDDEGFLHEVAGRGALPDFVPAGVGYVFAWLRRVQEGSET